MSADFMGALPAKAREQLAEALWERGVLAMSGNQAAALAETALSVIDRWLAGCTVADTAGGNVLPFDARDRIERTLRASDVDTQQAEMLAHRVMLALTFRIQPDACVAVAGHDRKAAQP